jgi:pantetheine-phosphate adenylyltransferase
MSTRSAVIPGSFDPVTYGHLNIIERALRIFDRVHVGVALNVSKEPLFTMDERIYFIQEACGNDPRITVGAFDGLLVDHALERGATALVRGLRAVSDFEYEFQMAHMNRKLKPEIETVFLMAGEEFFYVSSKLVKEVASLGGDVEGLVPPVVMKRLRERLQEQENGA